MPLLYQWYCKGAVINSNQGIFLTFDDGPHPTITPWVLKELAPYDIQAAFFCIGDQVNLYPEVLHQIQQEGHLIGNHTQSHNNAWKTNWKDYWSSIQACEVHLKTQYFRPPYGKIKRTYLKKLKARGFEVVLWSLLSRDYDARTSPSKALKALKKHSRRDSVVVFHDSEKAFPQLKEVLPAYLRFLEETGWIKKKSLEKSSN